MTTFFAACTLLAAVSTSDRGMAFTDEEPISLDLGGKTREVRTWRQDKWNGQALSVAN